MDLSLDRSISGSVQGGSVIDVWNRSHYEVCGRNKVDSRCCLRAHLLTEMVMGAWTLLHCGFLEHLTLAHGLG